MKNICQCVHRRASFSRQRLARRAVMQASIGTLAASMLTGHRSSSTRAAQDATPGPTMPTDLASATPLPLTGERRAQFEAYVADALVRFDVPGAAVAVVQSGDVVYLKGFGVRAAGSTQAVDPDTMFIIGSITKSMTTMLAAALVDDGDLTWETPLVALLPEFAVGDPELTRTLSVRDAFCNCVGIPGRNLDVFFDFATLTPERVIASLADMEPVAARGERFLYNNALVATGGYAAGAARGGRVDDAGLVYDTALRERVLGPIGMVRSTFDPDTVLARGNYALPHTYDLSGALRQLSVSAERGLLPIRPAGGLWSNAREMARYLQTELARGMAPDGTRVVSEESLAETWAPSVDIAAAPGELPLYSASQSGYAMGWLVGDYHGLRLINHAGGSSGFGSEMAFLPEADLGIVVLTNSLQTGMLTGAALPFAVQFRLFELLFELPAEFDDELAAQPAAPPRPALGAVDAAAVGPYLGRYVHPELGEVTISLRDDRLILDAGEFRSELRPGPPGDSSTTSYLLFDPPLSSLSELGATLTFSESAGRPELTLTLPGIQTLEQAYVFEPIGATGTPTP